MRNEVIGLVLVLAAAIHWCGDLLDWIAESWMPPEDEADAAPPAPSAPALDFDGEPLDDAISGEALAKEQLIRGVVAQCVEQELPAETIRLNLLGLCRSLGALSQLAAEQSNHKQTCMEAAGVIAVTASCERMLRSVSGFQLIQQYRFHRHSDDASA